MMGKGMSPKVKGVRAVHEEYEEHYPSWERCSDVIEGGTRTLHEKGEEYLPKYTEEVSDSYEARLNRTPLYNAAFRTVIGCRGLLMRKPAVVAVPESVRPMLNDVTLSGMPMAIFIGEIIEEVLTTGRVGVWVNYPEASDALTMADAKRMNLRPSMHKLEAESITNWKTRRINNETRLSLVVIKEDFEKPIDEFTCEEEERYRVLDLVDLPDGSIVYRVRIMSYDKEKDIDITHEEYVPLMGGKPLDKIPFYFISPDCTTTDIDEPPFIDLVDLSLTHYELTSSLLSGCYWSGLPQVWVAGVDMKDGEKLRMSPSAAWVFPTVGAKTGLIEVGNAGFPALEKTLDRLEKQMVLVGTRALELQKAGGTESMATASLHLSAEHSVLASIGQSISAGLTAAMQTFVQWTGNSADGVKVVLNKDFFNEPITPDERNSIVAAWQAGAISDKTKFELLQDGGDYQPDTKFEDEQKELEGSTGVVVEQPNTGTDAPDTGTQDSNQAHRLLSLSRFT